MPTEDEYEAALTAAAKDLASAATADDVRKVWRAHTGTLGHRTLGRLLLGQSLDRMLERRQLRALEDEMSDPYVTPTRLPCKTVTLEPLAPAHSGDLFEALNADAELWAYLPSVMPRTIDEMGDWIEYSLNDLATQRIPYAVVLNQNGKAIGSTSYLFPSSANRTIEVGWTWYGRAYWRSSVNTECKYALFSHAFDTLKCMRVGLRADLRNERSQQAIERLGCVREGVLRKWQILPDGHQRNVVFFSMLDDEWPARKAWFEERLG